MKTIITLILIVALTSACSNPFRSSDTEDVAVGPTADTEDVAVSPTADSVEEARTFDWVFAKEVTHADRTELREEMVAVHSWFKNQYGVEATGFRLLAGVEYESLVPQALEAGIDLSSVHVPPGYSGPESFDPDPFIHTDKHDRLVIVFIYGIAENPIAKIKNSIVHEYFHILQYQLAPDYPESEIPYWIVEGSAEYADHIYSQAMPGRDPFLGGRKTPFEDLWHAFDGSTMAPGDLERLGDHECFRSSCQIHPIYTYAIAFAATLFLVEQSAPGSYVNYWKLLDDLPPDEAFEKSFGLSVEDFYGEFEEWLPSKLPSISQVKVWLDFPGRDTMSSPDLGNILWKTDVIPDFQKLTGRVSYGGISGGFNTISSPSTDSWTGYLGLWWCPDECTKYRLGWYKDGSFTDQETEATVIQFTGESFNLEWKLPARPDELPRLSEENRCNP